MNISSRSRRDVVVVGGRVAGSATAMLLARLGHDVVVLDQASFPSDTTSTHSIARSGVVQLHRWGLLDAVLDSGAPPTRQVTFHALGESVTRTIKHKAGVDLIVSPRRYVLDAILAAACSGLGITGAAAPLVAVAAAVIAVLRTGSPQAAILAGMPALWVASALLPS